MRYGIYICMAQLVLTGIFILIIVLGRPSHADIYKYVDENGVTHFTNTPSGDRYQKIIFEDKNSHHRIQKAEKRLTDYHQIIDNKSRKYNLKPSIVKAVIKIESNWDSKAVSKKGAMGLMQLMPATARDMDVRNPFDPEENIEGGTRYLKYLLDKFNGDLTLALAAYNAGPKNIERFGGIPPIPETRQYLESVLSLHNNTPTQPRGNKPEVMYKILYQDGTVLYTNTPTVYFGSSRF